MLRAGLTEVALADDREPSGMIDFVDFAVRRWLSFERRRPKGRTREQDLLRGLKEHFGDDLYYAPGLFEHVSERFAAYLVTVTPSGNS